MTPRALTLASAALIAGYCLRDVVAGRIQIKGDLDIGDALGCVTALVVTAILPDVLARLAEQRSARGEAFRGHALMASTLAEEILEDLEKASLAPISRSECQRLLRMLRRLSNLVGRITKLPASKESRAKSDELPGAVNTLKRAFTAGSFPRDGYSPTVVELTDARFATNDLVNLLDDVQMTAWSRPGE